MNTFHKFTSLSAGLRARIWEMTVEPRVVEVRVTLKRYPGVIGGKFWMTSSTPVPAPLQTCREARNLGLYQRAFSEIAIHLDAEPRYVWLNLDIDMVSIGTSTLEAFRPVAPKIKRLMFERANSDEAFYHSESRLLKEFSNVSEIHIVCLDRLEGWYKASDEHPWPCSKENLVFIDSMDGRVMRSIEMDHMLDEPAREQWAEDGFKHPSGDPIDWDGFFFDT